MWDFICVWILPAHQAISVPMLLWVVHDLTENAKFQAWLVDTYSTDLANAAAELKEVTDDA